MQVIENLWPLDRREEEECRAILEGFGPLSSFHYYSKDPREIRFSYMDQRDGEMLMAYNGLSRFDPLVTVRWSTNRPKLPRNQLFHPHQGQFNPNIVLPTYEEIHKVPDTSSDFSQSLDFIPLTGARLQFVTNAFNAAVRMLCSSRGTEEILQIWEQLANPPNNSVRDLVRIIESFQLHIVVVNKLTEWGITFCHQQCPTNRNYIFISGQSVGDGMDQNSYFHVSTIILQELVRIMEGSTGHSPNTFLFNHKEELGFWFEKRLFGGEIGIIQNFNGDLIAIAMRDNWGKVWSIDLQTVANIIANPEQYLPVINATEFRARRGESVMFRSGEDRGCKGPIEA